MPAAGRDAGNGRQCRWYTRKRHEGAEGELRCAPAAWLWCSRHSERPPVTKSQVLLDSQLASGHRLTRVRAYISGSSPRWGWRSTPLA